MQFSLEHSKLVADGNECLGRSVFGGGSGWREECVGEIDIPISVGGDGIVKVNNCHSVDWEGQCACVDDAVDDSFEIGEVRDLVAASRGADGNLDDNAWASDVVASPDSPFI